MPSKHSPGPSPYIGWKWSKPQMPSKPRVVGEPRPVDDLRPGHALLRDVEPEANHHMPLRRRSARGRSSAPVQSDAVCAELGVLAAEVPHAASQPGTTHVCSIHDLEPSAFTPPRAAHCSFVVCSLPTTTPPRTHSPMCWCQSSFGPAKPSGRLLVLDEHVVAEPDDVRVRAVAVVQEHLGRGRVERAVDVLEVHVVRADARQVRRHPAVASGLRVTERRHAIAAVACRVELRSRAGRAVARSGIG